MIKLMLSILVFVTVMPSFHIIAPVATIAAVVEKSVLTQIYFLNCVFIKLRNFLTLYSVLKCKFFFYESIALFQIFRLSWFILIYLSAFITFAVFIIKTVVFLNFSHKENNIHFSKGCILKYVRGMTSFLHCNLESIFVATVAIKILTGFH